MENHCRAPGELNRIAAVKLRESGMPEEAYWETLFDVPLILDRLGIDARLRNVVEFGCGYGTFTIPVARRISGTVATFDIDEAMVEQTRQRAAVAGAYNVLYVVQDVFADGFGGKAGQRLREPVVVTVGGKVGFHSKGNRQPPRRSCIGNGRRAIWCCREAG